jgi:hypothetical protein
MTTEQPVRETRPSRRSSYGSELDAPVITHQQARPRAHSNDNTLRGENSGVIHDELPKMFPWRNEVIPEQRSPPINHGVDNLVEKEHSRPKSQIGFEKVIQSTYSEENNSNKYVFDNEKPPYSNGTSAVINMPVISPPKRVEIPTVPTRNDQRSRTPSPTSRDVYQRKTSYERQSDISGKYSKKSHFVLLIFLFCREFCSFNIR